MGSSQNQNQFRPYYINDRDCSLGICTKYCPQFCYIAFPPPPQDGSSSPFSPSIVTTIVVLAGALLLALSYYLIVTRYCKNRPRTRSSPTVFQQQAEMARTAANDGQSQAATSSPSGGLDEALIKTIAVHRYRKGDGLIEGTDCAVCLNEFEEDESLRLLPKCGHAFHLPCIDAWLGSHSSCPLCRAGVVVSSRRSTDRDACEIRQRPPDDLVLLVVDEDVRVLSVVVSEGTNDDDDDEHDDVSTKSPVLDRESASKFERSVNSLGTFCSDDRTVKIEQVRDECSSSSMNTL